MKDFVEIAKGDWIDADAVTRVKHGDKGGATVWFAGGPPLGVLVTSPRADVFREMPAAARARNERSRSERRPG